MNKKLLLSVFMLIAVAFSFASPATAADVPAGYDVSVMDLASAVPNIDPQPVIAMVERTCSACVLATLTATSYQKPATTLTPGGASAGIVLAASSINSEASAKSPNLRM